MRITLVNMPWGAIERPALGLSLLQAAATARGHDCRIRYANLLFADCVGAADCALITHGLPHVAFAGEWVFSEDLYGSDAARDARYVDEILRRQWQLDPAAIEALWRARRRVGPFLDALQADAELLASDLVGFTSTFEQNLASLALARRLKRARPDLAIIFGGANWEGPMGEELHRAFDFVDFVLSGEADRTFPALLDALGGIGSPDVEDATIPARPRPRQAGAALQATRRQRLAAIPGLSWRDRGHAVHNGGGAPVEAMDELPIPDFSDFFDARERGEAASQAAPVLLFETSRGCWWGARSHCKFCGLNGHGIAFRSKSAGRFLAELRTLVERWPCPTLEAVDNILDMRFFQTLLPGLETMDLPGPIFFEVKANLKRHHVAALRRARITRIQPGVESLSDRVLQLMGKGTTGLRNVQLLKWCREYGVEVDWNLLHGFPGETDADYDAVIAMLPRLTHLQLPGACGPIRLDRFSPYFERSGENGLTNVRPLAAYRHLYPRPDVDLGRIAYYFEFDYVDGQRPGQGGQRAAELAERLRRQPPGGTLQALPHRDGGLHLADTRAGASNRALHLSPYERTIVMRIDEVCSLQQVMHALHDAWPGLTFDADGVRAFLDELVSLGMALTDGRGHWLGLALMTGSLRKERELAGQRLEHVAIDETPARTRAPDDRATDDDPTSPRPARRHRAIPIAAVPAAP